MNTAQKIPLAMKEKFFAIAALTDERVAEHPLVAGIVATCVELGDTRIDKINKLTLKEYVIRIAKIKRSLMRHSDHGLRAYYESIQQHV